MTLLCGLLVTGRPEAAVSEVGSGGAAFETLYQDREAAELALIRSEGADRIYNWGERAPMGSLFRYDHQQIVRYFKLKTNGYGGFPTDFSDNQWWELLGVLPVVPADTVVDGIRGHANGLARALANDDRLYQEIHGGLESIPRSVQSMRPGVRSNLYDRLKALVDEHPEHFGNTALDLTDTNRVALVRMSLRGAMFSLLTVQPGHSDFNRGNFARLADDLRLQGSKHDILARHGVIVEDNAGLSQAQLEVFDLGFASRDRSTWQIGLLTTRKLLEGQEPVEAAYGQVFGANNTFSTPLDWNERTRPYDYEFGVDQSETPAFHIAFAHEIDHNSLDSSRTDMFRAHGSHYRDRKVALTRRAVGTDNIVLNQWGGVDVAATQQQYRAVGWWTAGETWETAWDRYWTPDRERYYPRDQYPFFLNAPQEAFASLGNLWYTDSYRFLELGQLRFDRGQRDNINQFLLYLDYGSRQRGWIHFVTSGGDQTLEFRKVVVKRNGAGHVNGLSFGGGVEVRFPVDGEGWVNGSFSLPSYDRMVGASTAVDPRSSIAPPPPPTTSTTVPSTTTTTESPTTTATTAKPTTTTRPTTTRPTTTRPTTTRPTTTRPTTAKPAITTPPTTTPPTTVKPTTTQTLIITVPENPPKPTTPPAIGSSPLVAVHSNLCLTPVGPEVAARIEQMACTGASEQTWTPEPNDDGTYRIINGSGWCLDVAYSSRANGGKLIQYVCTGNPNQRFTIRSAPNNTMMIVAKHSGLCLDIFAGSRQPGADLIQWPCHGFENQRWKAGDRSAHHR